MEGLCEQQLHILHEVLPLDLAVTNVTPNDLKDAFGHLSVLVFDNGGVIDKQVVVNSYKLLNRLFVVL